MYVSVERQNQLQVYRLRGDNLEPKPAYVATTLQEPGNLRPEQMVGPIHVHPSGKFVYLGNRASALVEIQGKKVAAGGENSIAVFTIDPKNRRAEAGAGHRHARLPSAHVLHRSERTHAGGGEPAGAAGARRRWRENAAGDAVHLPYRQRRQTHARSRSMTLRPME